MQLLSEQQILEGSYHCRQRSNSWWCLFEQELHPSKTLLHIAKVLEETESLKKMGFSFAKPKIDINTVRDWKNKI